MQINQTLVQLKEFRTEIERYSTLWFDKACKLAEAINVVPSVPRRCGRQTTRSNVPAESPETYYKRAITIPFLGYYIIRYCLVGYTKNHTRNVTYI